MEEIKKERRKFPRITVELIVRYKILSPAEQQFEGTTKNISGGGVCLVAREQYTSGTVMAMEIKFPHSINPAVVKGRVVWSKESGLGPSPAGRPRFDNGIEFEEISDSDRQQIIKQVNSEQKKTRDKGWDIGMVRDLAK